MNPCVYRIGRHAELVWGLVDARAAQHFAEVERVLRLKVDTLVAERQHIVFIRQLRLHRRQRLHLPSTIAQKAPFRSVNEPTHQLLHTHAVRAAVCPLGSEDGQRATGCALLHGRDQAGRPGSN